MSDSPENVTPIGKARKLSDAVREVKTAFADRDDVIVEMREATRMRLEMLAQELEPVFAQVPAEEPYFDFALSSGLDPRLWIDATAHVEMGRDRRTYRFVQDTRLGRVVLAESHEVETVADKVTRYIAERMVERQRLLEGVPEALRHDTAEAPQSEAEGAEEEDKPREARPDLMMANLAWFVMGVLAGMLGLILWLWDRLALVT